MLHLHSWFKHSAFDVRTTGCWKSAIFTENQELYAFLRFPERMEQKHSASERFEPEDLLRWPVGTLWIQNSRFLAKGRGFSTRRGVWFAARRLKMSGDIGGNWAMPGHSNPEKKKPKPLLEIGKVWCLMKFAQQLLTLQITSNYQEKSDVFVSLSLSLFVPFIPKSCHPRCCALHQRWLRWSWGCPAPNAGTAVQCVGFVNSWNDKKSHWFSWATSVKSLFLIVFTYLTLYSGVSYLRRDENSMCMQQPQMQAKTAKTRRNERLGAKLQKIVTLRCMSVSLALCWWQLYPASRKDTTTNLL